MKKQIMAVIVGSVMSTAAFAVEPVANPMALSDSQMDVVTAGANSTPTTPTTTTVTQVTQTQINTNMSTAAFAVEPAAVTRVTQTQINTNFGIDPTVCANVPILTFGRGQNVGAYNPQSAGGVQVVR